MVTSLSLLCKLVCDWLLSVVCKLVCYWLQVAVDGMARLFCMRYVALNSQRHQHQHITYTMEMGRRREKKKIKSPVLKHNKFDVANDYRNSPIVTRNHTPDRSPVFQQNLEQDIKDIRRAFRQFQNRIHDRDATLRVNMEWRVVATVLDKMFFFIYLSTIIVSLCTIFPWEWLTQWTLMLILVGLLKLFLYYFVNKLV